MTSELRPNDQRAKNTVNALWIMLGLEVLSLVSGFLQYNLLRSSQLGEVISMEAAEANDLREQIVGYAYLAGLIVCGVLFIMWFRRAYYNLHQKVNRLSFTEGWAAGGWFVPFVNLARPFQIMKELYEETIFYLKKHGNSTGDNISTAFLGWWWAFWIIDGIIGQVVFRGSLNADTIDQFISFTRMGMISNLVGIPSALLAIKVVRDYAKLETELYNLDGELELTRHLITENE